MVAGEIEEFLCAGQRAQLHPVVPAVGHLRVPALRDGRPGAEQERKVGHPLPAGGGPARDPVRHARPSPRPVRKRDRPRISPRSATAPQTLDDWSS